MNQHPKIVVYTAIMGKRDRLLEASPHPDADYICYTDDSELSSETWTIRHIDASQNPRLTARRLKLLPHELFPEYKYSIWHDATLSLVATPRTALDYLKDNKIALFKHSRRINVYQEAREVLILKRDLPSCVIPQIKRYRQECFFDNVLCATGVLIREHNHPDIKRLMTFWWEELSQNSVRDQLSFNYAAWKTNTPFSIIPGNILNNPLFTAQPRLDSKTRNHKEAEAELRSSLSIRGRGILRNTRNYLVCKLRWGI
ncbi:MAG: hypothetical protein C1943_06580 [Halochromatium sp.]|nr:hypothetical protein [Halochromatium sp.]